MRRTWGAGLLGLGLAGAACSGGGGDDDSAMASADQEESSAGDDATTDMTLADSDESMQAYATGDGAGGGNESVAVGAQLQPLPDIDARVVRTADLRIEVEKGTFGEQLRAVSFMARTLGG